MDEWSKDKQSRKAHRRQAIDQAKAAAKGAAKGAALGAVRGAATGAAAGLDEFPTLPWKRETKSPRARTPLSRDRIVEVALGIVDAEGTEAVSMRRVAEALDTGAASLYAYVSSKDEVLALVHELVLREVMRPNDPDARWQDVIRTWAKNLYEVYHRHCDLAKLAFADVPTGPEALDVTEQLLGSMISGGVSAEISSWLIDRLALYIAADAFEGWLMYRRFTNESPQDPRSTMEKGAEWIAGVREFFSKLPKDRYPYITGNLASLVGGDSEKRFDFGVDLLIAGAEAMSARESKGEEVVRRV